MSYMEFLNNPRFQTSLNSFDEGIIFTDALGKILHCNSKACEILDITELELKNKSVSEVINLQNQNKDSTFDYFFKKALKTKETVNIKYPTCLKDKKNREYYTKIIIDVIKSQDKLSEITGSIIRIYDQTDKYLLQQELQKALRIKSLSQLLSGLAHDFNNILTSILGNVSLAKFEIKEEDQIWNLLNDAETGIEKARHLTKQLLTFSAEEQKEKELVALPEILNEMINFTLSGSNVSAKFDLKQDLWPIFINKTQISLVFYQIVLNSIQAMPLGGEIEIKAYNQTIEKENSNMFNPGNYVVIEIQDQGIGIPKEELDFIFDEIHQSEYISQDVNFSIVKNIIDQHLGYIDIKSKLGAGITFTLYLPAEYAEISKIKEQIPVEKQFTGKILIMDDEMIILKVLNKMLTQLGFEVVSASNSDETIKIFKKYLDAHDPFKIVILDLTIRGGKGGVETLQELLRLNPSIKVIASSGYATDKIMIHFRDYGFSGSLVKPYKLEELQETLRKLL
ncbi:hybrid sensor histidine kinase/response regulator [Candidatus Harpocratesius sp.]